VRAVLGRAGRPIAPPWRKARILRSIRVRDGAQRAYSRRIDGLSVKQTTTGYWVVQRGATQLVGAVTREAAEAEREMRERLHDRCEWRHRPATQAAREQGP
jgi:hypothetical protein